MGNNSEKNMAITMKYELLEKVNQLLLTMNLRQQSIGREILIDTNFQIFEESSILLLKDKKTGVVYKLQDYIKAKCNCG